MEQKIIRGKRILLVDDEPSVRGAFRMMLEIDDHTHGDSANLDRPLIESSMREGAELKEFLHDGRGG